MGIVVRTISAPGAFAASLKKTLADALPDRPISDVETMESVGSLEYRASRRPFLGTEDA
jgi:hypothetical protein